MRKSRCRHTVAMRFDVDMRENAGATSIRGGLRKCGRASRMDELTATAPWPWSVSPALRVECFIARQKKRPDRSGRCLDLRCRRFPRSGVSDRKSLLRVLVGGHADVG